MFFKIHPMVETHPSIFVRKISALPNHLANDFRMVTLWNCRSGTSTRRRFGPVTVVPQILSDGSLSCVGSKFRGLFLGGHTNVSWINIIMNVEKEFPLFLYCFFSRKEVQHPRFWKKIHCVTFTSCSPPRSCSSSAFTANWKCSISKATSGVKGLASETKRQQSRHIIRSPNAPQLTQFTHSLPTKDQKAHRVSAHPTLLRKRCTAFW